MIHHRSSAVLCASCVVVLAAAVTVGGCRRKEPDAPPVATPSITLNRDKAPLGSPLEITYKFVVASDARFDQDYRVMLHVVDTDEEMIWTDDHNPPTPTSQWKGGQTIEYTRTIFVPVYPYVGEVTLQVGLYSTIDHKRLPLAATNVGQRAYRVARLQLQPQTENLPTIFKEGWHPAEVAEHNATVQWQWTKKDAVIAFKNPKKDCLFYFDLDNPGSAFNEPQQVTVSVNGTRIEEFTLQPKAEQLRRIPFKSAQLGTGDMAELRISVDKTYVPALLPAASSKDPRELGVRVFHAFVDQR
jgi:hypothetical protein